MHFPTVVCLRPQKSIDIMREALLQARARVDGMLEPARLIDFASERNDHSLRKMIASLPDIRRQLIVVFDEEIAKVKPLLSLAARAGDLPRQGRRWSEWADSEDDDDEAGAGTPRKKAKVAAVTDEE
eukprot:9082917-Lingulodinium_polyedra.AAC.1